MYITNLDEVVPVLRGRLQDYLHLKFPKLNLEHKFKCFVHDDHSPSMSLNPKDGETVHCFGCGKTLDIFGCASVLDNLPENGSEWVQHTVPHLCKLLEIPLMTGEPSLGEQERLRLHKLAQDITDIVVAAGDVTGYAKQRNWEQGDLQFGTITEQALTEQLIAKGWSANEIVSSLMVRTNTQHYFGADKLTFVLKDERGRPCGFMYRNLSEHGPKYVNTPESVIYSKSKLLAGLDTALQQAKRDGLVLVEGLGDLAQLRRLGITNSAATCGTALTESHLIMLKSYGIRTIYLSLDWDSAGQGATSRIFFDILPTVQGVVCHVIEAPAKNTAKDLDEYLKGATSSDIFFELQPVPAFEWTIKQLSDNTPPDVVCTKLVPIIAAEPAAVKRETLIRQLAKHTDIPYLAISQDVNTIRNGLYEERKERLLAEVELYRKEVSEDANNIIAIQAQHEERLAKIEKEYSRDSIGVNYQIQRFETIQALRETADATSMSFTMGHLTDFSKAMNGGLPWTTGCMMVAGGRANSGKTAFCVAVGSDIAMNDPDAIVGFHFTDDSYDQTEPRIKANLIRMLYPEFPKLKIGMIVNPKTNLLTFPDEYWDALKKGDDCFKTLLSEERLFIIDSEDGSTTSTLEKNIRYYRHHYPDRKMMIVCDGIHNYTDFYNLEQTQRITQIATTIKNMTGKYHLCAITTAEYRKNIPKDPSKMSLPVDDDLADARALMFRPNVIFHVYNDLHDRREHAEIFWTNSRSEPQPRLLLNFTKNKISNYKGRMTIDLDPESVTLKQYDEDSANREAYRYSKAKQDGNAFMDAGKVIWNDTEYSVEDDE